MGTKNELKDIVTIQTGHLYTNPTAVASDSKGKKTYICWPELSNMAWLRDVKRITSKAPAPYTARYKNDNTFWYFKLSCYHGSDGWWYDFDEDECGVQEESYRLFIPSKLEFHPDYKARSDKS